MAEKKVYSTTVLGAKPHRGRPADRSVEVSGNVEYKESKSKTPRSEEEKKALNTIKVGTLGPPPLGRCSLRGRKQRRIINLLGFFKETEPAAGNTKSKDRIIYNNKDTHHHWALRGPFLCALFFDLIL